MRQRSTCSSFVLLLLAGAAAAVPAGVPTQSGAPLAEQVLATPAAAPGFVGDGPDDAGTVVAPAVGILAANLRLDARDQEPFTAGDRLASDFLAALSESRRSSASLQIELARGLDAMTTNRAALAETAWVAGRFDEAIDAVRALEYDGIEVDVAVSFLDPPSLDGPTLGSNVMVSATVDGETATDTAVDVDRHSGHLLVMGRAAGAFSIFRSINGGNSWAETATWCCDPGQVDLSVAAAFGYVAYDVPADTEIRMRRVFGTTGAFDATYFWKPVALHAGVTVQELVMEANADVYDNRIYTAAHLSDGTLAWWWSDAVAGETFNRSDPGVANVGGGLSMSYVHGYDASTPYLFVAYRSAAGNAWVFPRSTTWGAAVIVESGIYGTSTTSISAYGQTVLVGYSMTLTEGIGASYAISYDGGAIWSHGTLAAPAEGGDFFYPLVSARSGTGTAMIVQEEAGPFDFLDFKQRHNFEPGTWSAIQRLNDVDFLTGGVSADMEYLYTGWGLSYLAEAGPIWFTLSRDIFYSGFERGNRADWSVSVP